MKVKSTQKCCMGTEVTIPLPLNKDNQWDGMVDLCLPVLHCNTCVQWQTGSKNIGCQENPPTTICYHLIFIRIK